jgi:hypothetical protein
VAAEKAPLDLVLKDAVFSKVTKTMDSQATDCEIYEAIFIREVYQLCHALFATGKCLWEWEKLMRRDNVNVSRQM